jgi:hypothetical protein
MSAFALPIPPEALSSLLHRLTERSSTVLAIPLIRSHAQRLRASTVRLDFDENALASLTLA